MAMKLTVLGSGSCIPTLERGSPGYALKAGKSLFLIEMGPGTLHKTLLAGIDYTDVDAVFFSHYSHSDHVSDLAPLLQALFVGTYHKWLKRKKTLTLVGPKGFKYFHMVLLSLYPFLKEVGFKVRIVEMPSGTKEINGVRVRALRMEHENTIGYRFEHGKRVFAYSGDTGYCQNAIKIGQDANALMLECSFAKKSKGHLTPVECGRIAAKAKAETLILTHFYPEMEKVDIREKVRKYFAGKILLAHDLMEIPL